MTTLDVDEHERRGISEIAQAGRLIELAEAQASLDEVIATVSPELRFTSDPERDLLTKESN